MTILERINAILKAKNMTKRELANRIIALGYRANKTGEIPSDKGKIIKIYYATQVDCAPPTIMLVLNRPNALHFSYKRYLVNYFRANFDFSGVPIVILAKGREKSEVTQ